MGIEDHPTVKHFRNQERTGQSWDPVAPQILDSDRLLKLALDCGADDAGLVAISNPALDDQRAGIKVAINYRSSEADAQKTAQAVKDAGSLAHLVRADVSSTEEVHSMVSEISDTLGPIDILINNAGVLHSVGHEETTPEIWQQTLDINLTGTYNVTWAVKDGMIERKFGRIVNMSSIGGLSARPYCIAYSVSKAGVIALTRSLAQAVAAHNIRINAVAPGLIETEMIGGLGKERRQKLIEDTPISRLGTPAEIANLVYFLLSEESSFTTGQTVVASGGRDLLP